MRRTALLACTALSAALAAAAPAAAQTAFTSYARYDAMQRVTGTIAPDPDGAGPRGYPATRNTYDAAGRLTRVETGVLSGWQDETVTPAGWSGFTIFQTVDSAYDVDGRKVSDTLSAASGGPVQSVTQYSYDPLGRPLCTAVRMNLASLPADACTAGAQGSFGPDRIARNVYDPSTERLTKVQKAYGTSLQQDYVTYEYSANGKQKAVIDANGNRAEMTYDGFDRQTRWTFPSAAGGGAANPNDYEEYQYDPNGNHTSLRKRDASLITYAYDALNRMTQKSVPASATGAAGYSVYTGYDNRGLQLYARFGSPAGPGISNSYDNAGRLASTSTNMDGTARTLSYGYDADGDRTHLAASSGSELNWSYDAAGAMTVVFDGSNPIVQIAYDSAGRRQGLTMTAGGTSGVSYGYDPAGRLTVLGHSLAGTASQSFGFAYNPASQIVTRSSSNDAYASTSATNTARTYTPNGLNQYSAVAGNSYAYDANGNLTSDGVNSYVYDAENRLVSRSGGVSLSYDPNGRLWQVSAPSGTTRFEYDGDKLIQEYDGAGTRTRLYAHGAGPDEPLAWWENVGGAWQFRFLHADHQGSVIAATDGAGNVVGINAYDAWGVPNSTSIATVGRFGYTGQAWLPELGMYYYKARIYSPMLGRFLQTDPIGYKDQVNLYAYVGNDPVDGRDPMGLYDCSSSDCKKISPLVSRLEFFASHFRARDAQQAAALSTVQHALATIGKENDGNGLTISDASLNSNYNSKSLTLGVGNGSEIKLDFRAIGISARAMGDNNSNYLAAAVLGHEGSHSWQDRTMSSTGTNLSVVYQREQQAYTAESYIHSFYGTQAFKDRGRFIKDGAEGSCYKFLFDYSPTSRVPFSGACK